MNQAWRGRALGCPPVSVGGRNNHAVVVLTYIAFLGFDFNSRKNGGPPNSGPVTTNYRCSLATIAELRQFWGVMRRLLAGHVFLAEALSLAAQNLPGVPTRQ